MLEMKIHYCVVYRGKLKCQPPERQNFNLLRYQKPVIQCPIGHILWHQISYSISFENMFACYMHWIHQITKKTLLRFAAIYEQIINHPDELSKLEFDIVYIQHLFQ